MVFDHWSDLHGGRVNVHRTGCGSDSSARANALARAGAPLRHLSPHRPPQTPLAHRRSDPVVDSTDRGEAMKKLVMALCLVLFARASSADTTEQQRAQMHRGSVKILTGAVLIGAGAVSIPLTGVRESTSVSPSAMGAGLIFAGGTLVWLGVQDQRHAVRP